jgi:NADH dehydrogenase/NADH:ubiquinone oxidoreductase subunit G
LVSVETIDLFDIFCSSIKVDLCLEKVMRILPINNININEDWITNKVRYFYDLLYYQRLTYPFLVFESKLIRIT